MATVTEEDYRAQLRAVRVFWEELPKVDREIDDWDLLERVDFLFDEAVTSPEMHERLELAFAQGKLPGSLWDDFREVKRLANKNGHILDRIRERYAPIPPGEARQSISS